MTRRFSHSVALPVTVEAAFAVLTDPGALARRYAASGSSDVVVERVDAGDGGDRSLTYRRTEAGSLPPAVARLVRGAAQVTQTDAWRAPSPDGSRHASWTVRTKGVAVDVGGEMTLTPTADGCVLTESGAVTAHLPLVGSAVEKLAVEQSAVKLAREWDWLRRTLRTSDAGDGGNAADPGTGRG